MLSLEDMALRQEAKKKNENKGTSFQGNDGAVSAGEYNSQQGNLPLLTEFIT